MPAAEYDSLGRDRGQITGEGGGGRTVMRGFQQIRRRGTVGFVYTGDITGVKECASVKIQA